MRRIDQIRSRLAAAHRNRKRYSRQPLHKRLHVAGLKLLESFFAMRSPFGISRWRSKRQTLNRSAHWKSADSYAHARRNSPFPEMPVR
jgi:hypothetical protein